MTTVALLLGKMLLKLLGAVSFWAWPTGVKTGTVTFATLLLWFAGGASGPITPPTGPTLFMAHWVEPFRTGHVVHNTWVAPHHVMGPL